MTSFPDGSRHCFIEHPTPGRVPAGMFAGDGVARKRNSRHRWRKIADAPVAIPNAPAGAVGQRRSGNDPRVVHSANLSVKRLLQDCKAINGKSIDSAVARLHGNLEGEKLPAICISPIQAKACPLGYRGRPLIYLKFFENFVQQTP